MGRASNRHKTWAARAGEAVEPQPYRAFPRTSDGVDHPVEVTYIPEADWHAKYGSPVTYEDNRPVYLDNDGRVVSDD